MSDLFAVAQGA